MAGDSIPRIAALAWLALTAYSALRGDHETLNTLAPVAFLAAGYLFGDTIMRTKKSNDE